MTSAVKVGMTGLDLYLLGERLEIETQAEGERAGEMGADLSRKPSGQRPCSFATESGRLSAIIDGEHPQSPVLKKQPCPVPPCKGL